MSVEESLLGVLVFVTAIGVTTTLVRHRRQVTWRKRDLLRGLTTRWANALTVPTPVDALSVMDHEPQLPLEGDPHFPLAFKLVPRRIRRRHKEFLSARIDYMKTCRALHGDIGEECSRKTGLPLVASRNVSQWPFDLLTSDMAVSIYEAALRANEGMFRVQDISYRIDSFSYTGEGFSRRGFHLKTTFDGYSGLELAQAEENGTLELVQACHREMMETDYVSRFASKVAEIELRKENAANLANEVRDALREFEVS